MPDDKAPDSTPPAENTPKMTVEELAAQLEQIKKAQAGSDKAYAEASKKAAELAAENEKLKKEKMTEKERADFEIAKQKAELEAQRKEVADATLRLAKARLMAENKLDPKYEKYIDGANDEEILNSIKEFSKDLDELVGSRVNEKLVGTEKPKAGTTAPAAPNLAGLSLRDIDKLARDGKLKIGA